MNYPTYYGYLSIASFALLVLPLLMAVVLRFTLLARMDTYMSTGVVSSHRAGPVKASFFPLSMDVIADYGSASAFKVVWNRRYPDVDRESVPRWLRLVFGVHFIAMIVGGLAFFGIGGFIYLKTG